MFAPYPTARLLFRARSFLKFLTPSWKWLRTIVCVSTSEICSVIILDMISSVLRWHGKVRELLLAISRRMTSCCWMILTRWVLQTTCFSWTTTTWRFLEPSKLLTTLKSSNPCREGIPCQSLSDTELLLGAPSSRFANAHQSQVHWRRLRSYHLQDSTRVPFRLLPERAEVTA